MQVLVTVNMCNEPVSLCVCDCVFDSIRCKYLCVNKKITGRGGWSEELAVLCPFVFYTGVGLSVALCSLNYKAIHFKL